MANIRTLSVSIIAKTRSFASGITRARKLLKGFTSEIPLVNRSVTSLGIGFATAATAGIAYMTQQSMQAIDAAGKLADQLGISTERLTGYQHAANLAGVSNEELSKGILRLQKNISDAASGEQAASDLFKELGLSIKDMHGMSADQQFLEAANALSGLANQADRTRVAQDLFGRSGFKMISMLKGGSEELDAMRAEAERLGLTFSRDAAAGVEAANDAVARAKEGLQGIANQIAIAVSPAITDLATRFTNLNLAEWGKQAGAAITDVHNRTIRFHQDRGLELMFERGKAAALALRAIGIHIFEGWNGYIQYGMYAWKSYIGYFVGAWKKALSIIGKMWGTLFETLGKGMIHIQGMEKGGEMAMGVGGKLFAESSALGFKAFDNEWLKEAGQHWDKAADSGQRITDAWDDYWVSAQRVADLQGIVERNSKTRGIANDPLMGGILSNAIRASVEATKGVMGGVAADAVKVASGSFEQIDLSRVSVSALAGMGRPQKTEDVNGKKQVKLLERLVQQNDEDMVAVAG